MKVFTVMLAVLVAGASAMPGIPVPKLQMENAIRSGQPRLVTDQIVSAIEDVSQAIIDAGLDPVFIDNAELDYALPVPSIFKISANAQELLFQGLSNIVIDHVNFNLITTRLTLNLRLPQILLNIRESAVRGNFFSRDIDTQLSGRFSVENVVVTANVRVSVGIISGISIRDISLTFAIGNIDSQVNLIIQGNNYSNAVNQYLGATVPGVLKDYESDINQLLTIVGEQVISAIL